MVEGCRGALAYQFGTLCVFWRGIPTHSLTIHCTFVYFFTAVPYDRALHPICMFGSEHTYVAGRLENEEGVEKANHRGVFVHLGWQRT